MKNSNESMSDASLSAAVEPPVVEVDKVCLRAVREHRIRQAVSVASVALCLVAQVFLFHRITVVSNGGAERSAVISIIDNVIHSL